MDHTDKGGDRERQETRLWLGVLRVHSVVFAELNRRMQDQTGVSLAKFDVLAQLFRSPEGLSMGKLSSALRVSNGNVSGLINRLMKDGLVEKIMSDADRRSFTAKLTDLGSERFHCANAAHHEILGNILEDLSDAELASATDAIRTVSDKVVPADRDG